MNRHLLKEIIEQVIIILRKHQLSLIPNEKLRIEIKRRETLFRLEQTHIQNLEVRGNVVKVTMG